MIAIPFFILDNFMVQVMLAGVIIYKYYYFIYKIKTVPAATTKT
jgi:uncharacterized protein